MVIVIGVVLFVGVVYKIIEGVVYTETKYKLNKVANIQMGGI